MSLPDRATITWLAGGASTAVAGVWALFKYFNDRRAGRENKKPSSSTGIPSDQVAELISALLHQINDIQPKAGPRESSNRGAPLNTTTLSKFLSLVLRHDPSAAFIALDKEGWANVHALIAGVNAAGFNLDRDQLRSVVASSLGKRREPRFTLSRDEKMIRANWGHSIPIEYLGREEST